MHDETLSNFRRRLEVMRRDLQSEEVATADRRAPVMLDQTSVGRLSRMDAMERQAMASAQSRRRKAELMRVDAALARVADGTFGECVRCTDDISEARLNVDPATPFCRACAGR